MLSLLLQLLTLFWFALAVLFWGGVHPVTSLVLLGGVAVTLLGGLVAKNVRWRLPRPLLGLFITLCLFLIIQTVSFWPGGLVAFLAPANYDFLSYLLSGPDGRRPERLAIAITPGETLFSLVRVVIFFIYLFILSAFFGHRSKKRLWPLWVLAGLGAITALLSLLLAVAWPDFPAHFYPGGATPRNMARAPR